MDVKTFRKLFVLDDSSYSEQREKSRSYTTKKEQLTDEKIQNHLDGKETVGLYQVSDGKIIWACIDIDVKKDYWNVPNFDYQRDWEHLVVLQVAKWKEVLSKYNITSYYEESGNKGAHVWFFFKEPVAAAPVKNALEQMSLEVKKVHDGLEWELYPKQPDSRFGNNLKGPNGRHQASQQFSNFVDQINANNIVYTSFETITSLSGALTAILDNCQALDKMVMDGLTARHLGHDERLQLAYIFGNLGDAGKAYIKNKVFRHMSDWDELTTNKNLDRIEGKYKPVTCDTLQKKGICPGPCDKIKSMRNAKSPISFYYKALGKHDNEENYSDVPDEVDASFGALDPLDKYYEKDGAYYEIQNIGKREETHWKISNFKIIVEEDLTVYDDLETTRMFNGFIQLEDNSGGHKYPFEISAENWADSAQVKKMIYKSAGVGNAKFDNISKIMKCVDKQNAPIERVSSKIIGYHNTDDGLKYYMPSVVISKDEIKENKEMPINFTGERSSELNSLDFKLISEQEFSELTDHIRNHYLKLTDENICLSLLGTAVLPFTYKFLPVDNKMFLLLKGETGLGKSFILSAVQRMYCQYKDKPSFVSWGWTPYSVQKASFFFKDALCVIDDFKRSMLGHDMPKAITMLQNYADNAGRGRLRSDMTTNITYYPRGVVAMSGEDRIEGEASTAARGILIEYPRKTKHNTIDGTIVQQNWDNYAGVTPYLIKNVLTLVDEFPKYFHEEFYSQRDFFNDKFNGHMNSSRIAQNFAVLATVVKKIVIPWLYKTSDEKEIEKIFAPYKRYLIKTMDSNISSVAEESSAFIFWNTFIELLSGQKIRIQKSNKELPGESNERGVPVGFYMENKDQIALNWGLVFDEVSKHLRSVGSNFAHSRTTVLQELYAKQFVLDEKPTPRNMNKASVRVVRIESTKLYDEN